MAGTGALYVLLEHMRRQSDSLAHLLVLINSLSPQTSLRRWCVGTSCATQVYRGIHPNRPLIGLRCYIHPEMVLFLWHSVDKSKFSNHNLNLTMFQQSKQWVAKLHVCGVGINITPVRLANALKDTQNINHALKNLNLYWTNTEIENSTNMNHL